MKKQTFALLPHRGVARITSVERTFADLGDADKLREMERLWEFRSYRFLHP